MSANHVFILALVCLLGGVALVGLRPGDTTGILLVATALPMVGGAALAKNKTESVLKTENKEIKIENKKIAEDLEATQTTLKKIIGE